MTTAVTVRAGDHERRKTADRLGLALTQGYLDFDEYDRRLQTAFAAATTDELRGLLADLPVERLRRADPRRRAAHRKAARRSVHLHLAGYLLMAVVCLTVWLAVGLGAGAWYFWPVWPILGAGIGLAAHAISVHYALPLPNGPCGLAAGRHPLTGPGHVPVRPHQHRGW